MDDIGIIFQETPDDRQLTEDIGKKNIDVAAFSEYLLTRSGDTHTLVINYCGIHKDRIEETVQRLAEAVLGD